MWITEFRAKLDQQANAQQIDNLVATIQNAIQDPTVRSALAASIMRALEAAEWTTESQHNWCRAEAGVRVETKGETQMGSLYCKLDLTSPKTFLALMNSLRSEGPSVG